jgi:hypothetical protein
MLRKLNRRRGYIYAAIGVVIFVILFLRNENTSDNLTNDINKLGKFLVDVDSDFHSGYNETHNHFHNIDVPHLQDRIDILAHKDPPVVDLNEHNENIAHLIGAQNEHLGENGTRKARITIDTFMCPPPCFNCPGENGSQVILSPEDTIAGEIAFKKDFFNSVASERMSLWRSLPDYRLEELVIR